MRDNGDLGFPDFPCHATIKKLKLYLTGKDDLAPWLERIRAEVPRRLSTVDSVNIYLLHGTDDYFSTLFAALDVACPAMRSLWLAGRLSSRLPRIPFPSLERLRSSNFQLDDAFFDPMLLPSGLRELQLRSSRLGNRRAAHLAGMKRLNEIVVLDFNLSAPFILPEGCAWQRVVTVSWLMGCDFKDVAGMHWPTQARLLTNPSHCTQSSLTLRWVMYSAEDARAASRAAMALSALPLQSSGPDQTDIHVILGGSHGSPSILAPLSAFITSITLLTPSHVPLSEVAAHLPNVRRLC